MRRKHLRDDVKTPYEKLKSLSGATGNLKPSLTFGAHDRIAGAQSDLEAARALNAARADNVNLFASGASASRTRFRHPRLFIVHARQGSDSIWLFDWLCASSCAKAVALAVCRPWGFSESVMGTVPAMRGARRGDRSRRLESGESGERRPEDSGTRQMARGGAKTAGETRCITHSRQPQVVQPFAVIGQRHLGPLALHLVETATSFSGLLPRPLSELVPDRGRIEQIPTAYFPRPVVDPEQRVRDVVKDAVGPFRRWETEMDGLLADGGEDAIARYGELLDDYEESGGYAIDSGIEAELSALGIDERSWDRPFSNLSGGEQTRCLLASLFVSDTNSRSRNAGTARLPGHAPGRRFPLIDEPTNHLDADGRRQLADYLRSKPGFLLISHDRAFLDACCDHVVALNRDTVEVERTSFSAWRERFRQRLARQRSENAALKEEIGRHT